MKVDEITLKHFLSEIHLIQRGKTFHKRISGIEENEKQRINLDRNLLDIFLFRIDRDPGAYGAILKIIEEDESVRNKTAKYIKKLLYDVSCDVDSFIIKSPHQVSNEKIKKTIELHKQNYSFSSHNTLSSPNVDANIEFLKIIHDEAQKNNDEIEAAVIKRIIDDYKSHYCFGKTPFIDDPARSEMQHMLKWDNLARAHIFSRLKKPELYIEDQSGGYDLCLRIFLPYTDELRDRFAEKFHIPKPQPEKLIENQAQASRKSVDPDSVCYYKFTTDAIFIAAEFWFNDLDDSSKLAFLNNEYPVNIDVNILKNYSVRELAGYADDLDNNGYLDEALEIYKNCLSRSSRMIDQFYFCDNLGCCYRDIGDYNQAYFYYKQANDLIKKIKKSDPLQKESEFDLRNTQRSHSFLVLLSDKNIGEMLHQIGKSSEGEIYYRDLIRKIANLKEIERRDLFLDLAQSYQNIDRFEEEMKVIIRLIHEKSLPKFHLTRILTRMELFEKSIGPNGKLNSQYLSVRRDLERGFALIKKSLAAKNSFQNHYAIKVLSRAPIISEPNYHAFFYFNLGTSYFEVGDYSNAKKYISTCIDESLQKNDLTAMSYVYLGLCEIFTDNKRESIGLFKKAITLTFNSDNEEQSENQFGLLIGTIATEGIWFDQEIVSWVVEQLRTEINQFMDEEKSTFYICSAFIKICQFSKALNHLEILIAKTDEQSDLFPVLIYRKGTLLADSGDFSGALDQFSRALQTPGLELNHIARGQIFHGMAIANRNLSNYIEAEQCAVEAFYCDPNNPEYCLLKEKLEDFNLYHVSTDSIKCLESRYTFKTAEREAMELYSKINDADEFDFSPPLGYYGKGLEILLDAEIWAEIRKKILEEYSKDSAYGIPKKQFMQIPEFFRWALSNNAKSRDTVSLGTWGNIILPNQDSDPIVNSIYQHLSEKFGDKYSIIQDACKFLAPYRNDVFHKLVLKKGEMESIRKIAIQHINSVISVIYGNLNLIPDLSETKVPIDIVKTEEASKFFRNNDFESAIRCYEDAINHDPTNTDALVGKANAYIQTGEAEKAINCLDIALHLDENDFDAHRVKGLWYATFRKDWRKAVGCFQQALKINPKDDMAMLNLGCAFWEIHEPAMGMKCFKKVKEINPNNPFVDQEYNNCIRALNGIKESLIKINKIIENSPEDLSMISAKGFLHYNLGEYQNAFECFDKKVKLFPEDSESWYFRGFSLLRLGKDGEADQSFKMVNFRDENVKNISK